MWLAVRGMHDPVSSFFSLLPLSLNLSYMRPVPFSLLSLFPARLAPTGAACLTPLPGKLFVGNGWRLGTHARSRPFFCCSSIDGATEGGDRERERDRKASPACASRMCVYADSREARRNGMRARASCSLPVTKHARRATGSRGYSAVDVTLRFLLLLLLLLQTRWERGVVFGLTDVCCYGHGCALLRCDSVSGHQARDRGW